MSNAYGYVAEQDEETLQWYVFSGADVIAGPFESKLAAESYADLLAKKRAREETVYDDGPGF